MPKLFHRLGVLWNHFIELIVPWLVFYPKTARHIAGILMISFQLILILSGNLSFLNWITIVPAIACFDDSFFKKILPKYIIKKAEQASNHYHTKSKTKNIKNNLKNIILWMLVIIISWLSIPVIQNLASSGQYMNTSFNQFDLVNTYGAFGYIGKERYELILEGTDEKIITPQTKWKEYEFKAKPGNPYRSLPIIAPYQPRIDWQIWFAAMESPQQNPWLMHLIWKLLDSDKDALSLLANNPFPKNPPKYIRVEYYRYQFAEIGNKEGKIWNRTYAGEYLPPLSKSTNGFNGYIKANGWKN